MKRTPAKPRDPSDIIHIPGLRKTIRKRGATRFDLRDPYFHAVATSWPRFFLFALGSVSTFHVVFAGLYLLRPGAVDKLPPGNLLYAYFFSVETLATVGYGEMSPASTYGHVVASIEIDLGIILTAILTGILFGEGGHGHLGDLADHAVVARQGDSPALMVRVANGRLSLLTSARAQFAILLSNRDASGHVKRSFHNLALVHETIPVFPLTWILVHKITERSPIAGLDQIGLQEADAQLFVSLKARDTALSVELEDVQSYGCADILFGRQYADTIEGQDSSNPTADLGKLSSTQIDEGLQHSGELT